MIATLIVHLLHDARILSAVAIIIAVYVMITTDERMQMLENRELLYGSASAHPFPAHECWRDVETLSMFL